MVALEVAIVLQSPGVPAEKILPVIGAHLIAIKVLTPLYSGKTLLMLNASSIIAAAISTQAGALGVDVTFATDSMGDDIPESWLRIPDYARQAELAEILPSDPSGFVSFSSSEISKLENEAAILSLLQPTCHTMTAKSLFSSQGSETKASVAGVLGQLLRKAADYAVGCAWTDTLTPECIALDKLARGVIPKDPLSVVDFETPASLPVRAARLDTGTMFKGSGRTYWIVGMSGALGISLCDWMISAGAKNIVVTSRDPDVSPEWISAHKRKGATVSVIPW